MSDTCEFSPGREPLNPAQWIIWEQANKIQVSYISLLRFGGDREIMEARYAAAYNIRRKLKLPVSQIAVLINRGEDTTRYYIERHKKINGQPHGPLNKPRSALHKSVLDMRGLLK